MKHKFLMSAASLALVLAMAGPHMMALAQNAAAPAMEGTVTQAADTPASAPVTVYGQQLNPQDVTLSGTDYTWADLQQYMAEVVPDADQKNLSANEVCDAFNALNDKYLADVEIATGDLIYKMEFAVNAGRAKGPADMALTTRLGSRDQKDLAELVSLLPGEKDNIMRAKDATLKSYAMLMLYDAAVANCPTYAQQKGYLTIN